MRGDLVNGQTPYFEFGGLVSQWVPMVLKCMNVGGPVPP